MYVMQLMYLKTIDQKKEDGESIHLNNNSSTQDNISTPSKEEQDEKEITSKTLERVQLQKALDEAVNLSPIL